MPNIFQNSLSGTIQDVPQIEALRTPDHVVLSKSTEVKIILPEGCAASTRAIRNRHVMLYDLNYLNISLKMASEVI